MVNPSVLENHQNHEKGGAHTNVWVEILDQVQSLLSSPDLQMIKHNNYMFLGSPNKQSLILVIVKILCLIKQTNKGIYYLCGRYRTTANIRNSRTKFQHFKQLLFSF